MSFAFDTALKDTPVFTRKGQPALPPSGVSPVWGAGDASVASLAPAADGLSAVITPMGVAGTYTYTFADGVLTYSNSVEFVQGEADAVAPDLTVAS